ATRRIHELLPHTEVLIYTCRNTEQLVMEALSAGARGYVLKTDPTEQLQLAVESLLRHVPYVTPGLLNRSVAQLLQGGVRRRAQLTVLTQREQQVVRLIVSGLRTHQIGTRLGISGKTVEAHRATIMRKLRVNGLAELVRSALRNQLDLD